MLKFEGLKKVAAILMRQLDLRIGQGFLLDDRLPGETIFLTELTGVYLEKIFRDVLRLKNLQATARHGRDQHDQIKRDTPAQIIE